MQRLTFMLFTMVFSYLLYQFVAGGQGINRQEEMSKQVEFQELTNSKLAHRNDALRAELENLRGGRDAIEEKVRTELQYIKEGETFYRMVEQ